ncbi:hypothetical protein AVEN_67874-1 [Araneus ventricosus]|uniref:Uncharacterized protein n=1 Tax=Araneus ventricosus TaxID=182803 RepID=A0A4Y2P360_ARAVE|nr:hypothetical protein AVEN_67874-1 [Araneus ventricosus]
MRPLAIKAVDPQFQVDTLKSSLNRTHVRNSIGFRHKKRVSALIGKVAVGARMASESIPLGELLQCLVECSEKAARIAQIFRDENDLFQLLVEEKTEIEKNKRFVQDFKTLADVLVQETIKRDVGEQVRYEKMTQFVVLSVSCVDLHAPMLK